MQIHSLHRSVRLKGGTPPSVRRVRIKEMLLGLWGVFSVLRWIFSVSVDGSLHFLVILTPHPKTFRSLVA